MFYRTYHRIAAVAVLGAVALTGAAQLARAQAAPPEKKVKDQGEYDIYNQTLKDANNPAALLKDLDTWAQKYPDSDWKDDRLYYYISAYSGTNQPAKVLEVGSQLRARSNARIGFLLYRRSQGSHPYVHGGVQRRRGSEFRIL